MRARFVPFCAVQLLAWALCVGGPAAADAGVRAYVAVEPVAYLAERVGGPSVQVGVLVAPGQNPHSYEPTPKQLADLSEAGVFFQTGLPFESRLLEKVRATNPGFAIVDLREGIRLRPMERHDHHEGAGAEAAGAEAAGAGSFDPHIWMSPLNAKVMAGHIAAYFEQADPSRASEYRENAAALERDLDAIHGRVSEILAPYRGRAFCVYHPSLGYFADAYGLRQVPVEVEGKEPTARQLAALIEQARREQIKTIFVQRQFPGKAAESLASELGGAIVRLDPLSRDCIANLADIADKMREGWR